MAVKRFGVNDAESNKLWSKELFRESIRKSYFYDLMGTGKNSLVQLKEDSQKGAGDTVTVTLLANAQQPGVLGGAQIEGNEEAMRTYTDSVLLNQLDFSTRVRGEDTIDAQRVPYNLREDARDFLANLWKERMDIALFNQLAGNTAQTDTRYTGLNATVAPSSTRIVRPATITADQSLTTSHKFSLAVLDKAVAHAEVKGSNGEPRIRPVDIPTFNGSTGKATGRYYRAVKYIAFLHNWQVHDLRADASSAGNWYDIQQAAIMGGETTNNPIFMGGDVVGVHNGVLIMKCESVPTGCNGSSPTTAVTAARRAVLCGAQAAICAFGQKNASGNMSWHEEMFDYGQELGVDSRCIFGITKTQFNSQDFGTIVMSTYAAAP